MERRRIAFWLTGAAAAVALGSILGSSLSYVRSPRIFPGVRVAGKPVGGLSKKQAEAVIARFWAARASQELAITYRDRRWISTPKDLGILADGAAAAEKAHRFGRDRSFAHCIAARFGIGAPDIPLSFKVESRVMDSVLGKIDRDIAIPHRDAEMRLVDGKFQIKPEAPGIRLDKSSTRRALLQAASQGRRTAEVVVQIDPPDIRAEDLKEIDTVLASYTTRFPAWRIARTHNIRIATARIDGTVVPPGGVFSYNEIVGPRDRSRGFREAPIFQNGMLVPGTGGGVCQVSSTLYNAALLSNMEILQRSHHSSQVPYVAKGRDATVAYGLLDLKFRNTASAPIYISAAIKGSYLTIAIYGSKRDKKDVAIQVLPAGRRSVLVYRLIKEHGKVVSRELISRDTYRPAIIAGRSTGRSAPRAAGRSING